MFSFERCLKGIGLALLGCAAAVAAPPLTVVQDVLFNADGTKFNGVATIAWQSFQASDQSNIPAHSISTQIVNGLLRVQLVPTTNALSAASYTVTYNAGNLQFVEYWAVPPANVPVRVKDVRLSGPGTVIGSGGGATPPAITSVNISDVVGLSSALNLRPIIGTGYAESRAAIIDATGALDGAVGNASDCLHVDGTSAPCGSGSVAPSGLVFVDGEIPSGAVNGSNTAFSLGSTPNPPASLSLSRNGLLLRSSVDYSLSGNQVTFSGAAIPQANDLLIASYRMGTNNTSFNFVDGEIPGGTIDGSNTAFSLARTPNPASSLAFYRNGLRLRANLDYVLSGASVVFQAGLAPQQGDVLLCSYRY